MIVRAFQTAGMLAQLSVEPVETPALLRQALDAQQRGDQPRAELLYLELLARRPQDFNANHLMGVLRFQQERPAEALPLLDRALTARPAAGEAWAHRGLVLHALGRSAEALADLDRSLALRPDQPEAL